ncbi:MAG: dihydrolipoamide acetyltransferase family protein [Bacteroidota bacterium]|nr:dihydrolipoamide acetyltransferase family protein [Bacteroidota bacterium]
MSQFDIVMPKMGESITQATITKWFKKVGDPVEEDDVLLEIATDKVDSEIPSPVEGVISKILFNEGDVVPVGTVIAVIALEGEEPAASGNKEVANVSIKEEFSTSSEPEKLQSPSGRFYSPLVKNIAKQESISLDELETIPGSGENNRVTKDDILQYIKEKSAPVIKEPATTKIAEPVAAPVNVEKPKPPVSISAGDEIVEMDRMRRIIADHMVMSKHTAPHVTNFVEADVTNLVLWRTKHKDEFLRREKINLTYMPVFLEVIARALKDFPQVNASVDGYNIILRKNINLGVAVALPTGNLIVPVIKNADNLNLVGLAKELNRVAEAARNNKLSPDDIQGGTFTISNFGSFKNSFGTPIINQPQVAVLGTGNIEKKPAVLETPTGDVIAIRHKMFLSLTYDHRIIDGALGGAFTRRLADYLEAFDINREI